MTWANLLTSRTRIRRSRPAASSGPRAARATTTERSRRPWGHGSPIYPNGTADPATVAYATTRPRRSSASFRRTPRMSCSVCEFFVSVATIASSFASIASTLSRTLTEARNHPRAFRALPRRAPGVERVTACRVRSPGRSVPTSRRAGELGLRQAASPRAARSASARPLGTVWACTVPQRSGNLTRSELANESR